MKEISGGETLHEYYQQQGVLPTFGAFTSAEQLARYEAERRAIFTDKLALPPRVFSSARLLEYGPDSGENSLVFATWGSRCTLVEPNPKAHPAIKDYFRRFNLGDRLDGLEVADIAQYAARPGDLERFDVIDAEGFIYTVKPDSLWIDLFARQILDGGLVVLFYYEKFGSFFELLPRVMHAWYRRTTGADSLEAAKVLFATKWNSIPHKRRLESWVMDVLENPFVRLKYFYDVGDLCRKMQARGFALYSSWPPYLNGLDVYWFKKIPSQQERLASLEDFVGRNCLSHLMGRPLFLTRRSPEVRHAVSQLVQLADSLIDAFDSRAASACLDNVTTIEAAIASDAVFGSDNDRQAATAAMAATRRLLSGFIEGRVERVVEVCNKDEGFIRTWGMPSHFAVFRYEPTSSA
jgi:hypothetical protein